MESCMSRLHALITGVVRDTAPEELACRSEGKWSVAEILEHLYLSYTATVKGFEMCLKRGRPLVTSANLTQRAGVFLITRVGYFPSGRKSPEMAQPCGVESRTVLSGIGDEIEKMDKIIAECETRFGSGPVLDHPILGPMSPAQWRKVHLLHALHHLKQITKAKQSTV